ncbi:hypothetical protein SAMN05444920_118211 [Nonomuraea solani]|uniref:Heparinase II/III-like protein n=1 Tax=Nonomuraea solani TaxID=1144553 RepID=A0A1H6ET90_9ACTN|nr:hypothetical protein [Nonomuraea solani]SEH01022.1 hypothetical protein SAMN05444920_118211 [Nonomuraea solani]
MLPRRTLLRAAALLPAATPLLVPGTASATTRSLTAALPDLPPPPAVNRTLFAPQEQRFAPYLATLAPMVNDMDDTGFFAGGWWRKPAAPYNARVQEHVFTLAWFHANARPWNPYTGSANLLAALDAALGHYLSLQHADGSWPEYSRNEHGLAPTGFGIGYLAKTLQILRATGALPTRQSQVSAALRTAVTWFLNPANRTVWQEPLSYANQTASGLAGASLALRLDPDPALAKSLTEAFARISATGVSSAGFFHEEGGHDMNYNFEVMLPELADAHYYNPNSHLVDMAHRFTGFLSYNLLREPDGSGYLVNVAPSTRTSTRWYDEVRPDPDRTALNWTFIRQVPLLGAFMTAREDLTEARAAWTASTEPVTALAKQDTSPRILTHGLHGERFPDRQSRAAAISSLPYLRSRDFVELRRDRGQDFLYVRKPSLYVGGYFGDRASRSRTGLTFVWHPAAGTIICGLNDNNHACWSTVFPGQVPDSNGPLQATYFRGAPGGNEWTGGQAPEAFGIRYGNANVTTDVLITQQAIRRTVKANAAAIEQIPLILQPGDVLTFTDGTRATFGGTTTATADGFDVRRGRVTIRLRWGTPLQATVAAGSVQYFRDGSRRFHALRIPHQGTFDLTVIMG